MEHKTQERKGCVDPPLFDCVPIESYAFPILHVMIGVRNDILKDFFRWVDWKIEEISEEEIKARKEWQKSMRQLKTHLATIAEWEREYSAEYDPSQKINFLVC